MCVVAAPAAAQQQKDTIADSTADTTAARVAVSPLSPRAAVSRYLELARDGRYAEAASYLDLPDSLAEQGATLARRLKNVLDRHLWIDLERVSRFPAGDTIDGLPRNVDQLGQIPGPRGVRRPVRLERVPFDPDIGWRFSRGTVLQIPIWYETLENRWVLANIPEVLQRPGPLEIAWWQWLALPLAIAVSWILGAIAGRLVRLIVVRIVRRTTASWDDALIARFAGPLTAALALAVLAALLPLLGLAEPAADRLYRLIRAGIYLAFFWSLWRLVDVGVGIFAASGWARATPSSRSLLPLGSRVTKALLVAIAAVAVLSMLGYPVASLVAGLGLGGLALALAAQKTVENLFGSFSIGVDQPFREGDFVKVEDFVGTVEKIGLRSTRFRTLERTLISIPNGRLAEMRLESFAARDRLRLFAVFRLVHGTTEQQMREVLTGFERVLTEHPVLFPGFAVRFREVGATSLDVEVSAWFATSDWNEFTRIRQEVLLQFMKVVEQAGSRFAFPTQTVYVAGSNGQPEGAEMGIGNRESGIGRE